jgi:hypothetical protein
MRAADVRPRGMCQFSAQPCFHGTSCKSRPLTPKALRQLAPPSQWARNREALVEYQKHCAADNLYYDGQSKKARLGCMSQLRTPLQKE